MPRSSVNTIGSGAWLQRHFASSVTGRAVPARGGSRPDSCNRSSPLAEQGEAMLKGRPHLSVGSLQRLAQVAGPATCWRWLLVVLAWLALASGSVAIAGQGAGCHCPTASNPAQAAGQSQTTGKKAMPCCDHGKGRCACTWGNFVAAPLLPPSLGAPHALRTVALTPRPQERWTSVVPGAETPPPRSVA